MQGAAPLASPRLNPRGTGKWGRTKRPAGGTAVLLAGLLCHCGCPAGGTMVLVAGRFFTLAVFLPPFPEGEGYPPTPFPAGRGEIFSLFRRGLRPRHPCIRPPAALTAPAIHVPSGWLAFFVARQPCLQLTFFPPSPLPGGKGGIKVISCKGLRPLHPRGLNPRFAAKTT